MQLLPRGKRLDFQQKRAERLQCSASCNLLIMNLVCPVPWLQWHIATKIHRWTRRPIVEKPSIHRLIAIASIVYWSSSYAVEANFIARLTADMAAESTANCFGATIT
jgi:hypothetical protein